MFPYVFITSLVGLLALLAPGQRVNKMAWSAIFALCVTFVGLRHHVGMDWNNYLLMIQRVTYASVGDLLAGGGLEPLYALLLRQSGQLGMGVYGANAVVAIIMMAGLFRYARTTPNPWTAVLVALPYLVIVVGMSANRQAAAIGVLLWAVAGWDRYSLWQRALLIALAATFHFSALIFVIFIAADVKMHWMLKSIAILASAAVGLYILRNSGKLDYYDSVYVSGQTELTESSGAIFHTMLNGLPAAAFFVLRSHRDVLLPNTLHRNMAMLALVMIPLSFVTSAAAGRISLYLFPVSIYFFSALPRIMRSKRTRVVYRGSCAVLFTGIVILWLTTANSSGAHVPYENYLTIPNSQRQLCC